MTNSQYIVKWHPEHPRLSHEVREEIVSAVSSSAATTEVANSYPAPIIVMSVTPVPRS